MKYTTQHVSNLFNIVNQTVRNYAAEFSHYLSPSARPGANRQRQFTDDDLAVFALIVEMKNNGAIYEDIHAALANGQRGQIPEPNAITPTNANVMLLALREQVTTLVNEVKRLELENAAKDGQIALLKEQLADANREIRKLERGD